MPVYFIADKARTAIKIGRGHDVRDRFASIQANSPVPLILLGYCSSGKRDVVERALHRKFALLRLHGEWFRYHPDILAEIETPARIVARSVMVMGRQFMRLRIIAEAA